MSPSNLIKPTLISILSLTCFLSLSFPLHAQEDTWWQQNWAMAGANPQRTGWVPDTPENQTEIRGSLHPQWYKPIEPYIPYKFQVIAAHNTLYIATAKGLYALDAKDGTQKWVYPTQLPLGHSPSITNGIVYVGGLDHRLHAIDAQTGQGLWTFTAQAAFETSPLVVNDTVYLGNHDGHFYAINALNGTLKWAFDTGHPILNSPAINRNQTHIYFASTNSHAYALNALTGTLVWRSAKLPGSGFQTYWPTVYTHPHDNTDYVVFTGMSDYAPGGPTGAGTLNNDLDRRALYFDIPEGELIGTLGDQPGDWAPGTVTIDVGRITQYLENDPQPDPNDPNRDRWYKPHRRRVFILNATNGQEFTFDSDNDNHPEYAPFAWHWTHSGNRYPAILGQDNVIYLAQSYISGPYIPRGGIVGWKFGTQYVSRVHDRNYGAVDEPLAISSGGKLIYWSLCCDREAGAYDITMPYGTANRSWSYFAYNLDSLLPGYDDPYSFKWGDKCATFGDYNGIYGTHGTLNPPIPYQGKLYLQRGNSIIAFGPDQVAPVKLPQSSTIPAPSSFIVPPKTELEQKLAQEIEKMLTAGHLRPGLHNSGLSMYHLNSMNNSYLIQYFHNPADTFITLISALPHLSTALQSQVNLYLEQEFAAYGSRVHIGWDQGNPREAYDTPPEIQAQMDTFTPRTNYYNGTTWDFRYSVYGRFKYVQQFNDPDGLLASEVFEQVRTAREDSKYLMTPTITPETDTITDRYQPFIKNAFIAGYIGYIGLGTLAGYDEAGPELAPFVTELDRLLAERATEFATTPNIPHSQLRLTALSRNFIYTTPELADYLNQHAYAKIDAALHQYQTIAPYWHVAKFDNTYGEGTDDSLFNYHSLFQAKALILKQPYQELAPYLDVPAFERGDLFYIQNLVAALEAPDDPQYTPPPSQPPSPSPAPIPGDINGDGQVDIFDYNLLLQDFGLIGDSPADINSDGRVDIFDYNLLLQYFGS